MKDKIIEIGKELYEDLNVLYHTSNSTSNKYDSTMDKSGIFKFIELFATRIDFLYSGGVNEDEVDRAYMRWYFGSDDYVIPNPNEPINNTFYAQLNTWRNCVEWYKPHPTTEISEEEIQDIYDLYCDRSQNVQTILGHPPQYEPLMSREAFMKVIKEWAISKEAKPMSGVKKGG